MVKVFKLPVILKIDSQRKTKKTHSDTAFQTKLLKLLDTNDTPDPDSTILMSFLPKFKKLTDDQKTDFQMYVLQFFKNLSQQNAYDKPHHPPPAPNNFTPMSMMSQNNQPTLYHQMQPLHTP